MVEVSYESAAGGRTNQVDPGSPRIVTFIANEYTVWAT